MKDSAYNVDVDVKWAKLDYLLSLVFHTALLTISFLTVVQMTFFKTACTLSLWQCETLTMIDSSILAIFSSPKPKAYQVSL